MSTINILDLTVIYKCLRDNMHPSTVEDGGGPTLTALSILPTVHSLVCVGYELIAVSHRTHT